MVTASKTEEARRDIANAVTIIGIDDIESSPANSLGELLANEQGVAVLAIKPMSKGPWPKGVDRTRQWWYRSTETQDETDMVMRFTLSLKNVVAGIPPSFLDLLDLAIEAGKSYRPIKEEETKKLQEMAKDCGSLFQSEEQRVANGDYSLDPIYADSPHECCPYKHA